MIDRIERKRLKMMNNSISCVASILIFKRTAKEKLIKILSSESAYSGVVSWDFFIASNRTEFDIGQVEYFEIFDCDL